MHSVGAGLCSILRVSSSELLSVSLEREIAYGSN